jgi:hypothetical protein
VLPLLLPRNDNDEEVLVSWSSMDTATAGVSTAKGAVIVSSGRAQTSDTHCRCRQGTCTHKENDRPLEKGVRHYTHCIHFADSSPRHDVLVPVAAAVLFCSTSRVGNGDCLGGV